MKDDSLFVLVPVTYIAIALGILLLSSGELVGRLVTGLQSSLTMTFILLGPLFLRRYGKGRVSWRRTLTGAVLVSAICAVIVLLIVAFTDLVGSIIIFDNMTLDVMTAVPLFLGLLLAFLLVSLIMISVAFGSVGWMSMLVARLFPLLIGSLRHPGGRLSALSEWGFSVPPTLDPARLRLSGSATDSFPRGRWAKALGLQLVVGVIVAIYISLNPFLLQGFTIQDLFATLTSWAIIIPFIVLSWTVLERLDLRIEGIRRDHSLHRGVMNRVYQTFIPVGTLFIFVRLALQEVDPNTIAQLMMGYFGYLLVTSMVVTYFYFNNFEEPLATSLIADLASSGNDDDRDL